MAPVLTRLYDFHTQRADFGGSGGGTDVYRIWDNVPNRGISIGQANDRPLLDGLGLPRLNDPHPEAGASLRVRSIELRPEGNSFLFNVSYAPPTLAVFRPPADMLAAGFTSLELSSRQEVQEFPEFILKSIDKPVPDGAAPERLFVWEQKDRLYPISKSINTFTAVLSGEFDTGLTVDQFILAYPAVRTQINRLHLLGGELYRYVGPRRIAQRTEANAGETAKWEVMHEWEYDPGIPNNFGIVPANGLVYRTANVGGLPLLVWATLCQDEDFQIRPYTRADWRADLNNPANPPIVTYFNPYTIDNNGWQTLPGVSA